MLDETQGFDPLDAGYPDAESAPSPSEAESAFRPIAGIHPAVFKIALSAVAWFLAVAWIDFARGVEVDLVLSVATGFFVMFFTLLLVVASMIVNDSADICGQTEPLNPKKGDRYEKVCFA